MAALGAQSIASSYEQLLHVDRDGGGNSTTHVAIKDGDNGTTFGFTIASDALMMSSTNRLEFGDTGTYIHQSADGVLDLVSDTEIELTATTIDMNGAADLSGNLTVGGDIDLEGSIDVNGTTNLDAVDIDGAVQIDAAVTVGADDQGYDFKFFGDTASAYMMWDTSADDLVFAGAAGIDLDGDIDVNGTANLDNTDIDGTLAVDGTTISLDATTSFNIDNSNTSNGITIGTATSGVPISIGHTTSETTVNDNLVVTGDIDLEGSIDVNGTANLDAVDIDGAVQIDNTVTVGADDQGYDVIFYGDTASSNMTWDTSGDDLILNDATLNIDQDDNVAGIYIDSEATSGIPFQIDSPATTTVNVLTVNNCNALTDGGVAYFHSNSASTNTRNVVDIHNDHTSATGATALKVTQDAAAVALSVDQNADSTSILIDSESTSANVLNMASAATTTGNIINLNACDALTTGKAIYIDSNSDDNSTRNLVEIVNNHTSADNTVGLYIQQDGADASIELTGNGSIKFPGTQGASSDANSLDDYEEGTWTAALNNTGDTLENATGHYVKVGSKVTVTWYSGGISGLDTTGGEAVISGLPFTTKSTSNSHSSLVNVAFNSVCSNADQGYFGTNGTTMTLNQEGGTSAATYGASSGNLMVSGTYFTH